MTLKQVFWSVAKVVTDIFEKSLSVDQFNLCQTETKVHIIRKCCAVKILMGVTIFKVKAKPQLSIPDLGP